jgi:predicted 3-demethylubiquinone-9 3-methyltransferase (glyoxalase superfamily)
MAMGREHPFSFTLAMSLFVDRDCQDELDPLHSKLVESDPSSCQVNDLMDILGRRSRRSSVEAS